MFAVLRLCLGFLVALFVAGSEAGAQGEKRVALVIGNSAYQFTPALPNPRNDAEDVAAVLKRLGFEVIEGFDVSAKGIEARLQQFARLVTDADAALVYYAGHGLQYRGENLLVPIDAKLRDEISLDFETFPVDRVVRVLDRARGAKILILDACRNLPLAGGRTSEDVFQSKGLAKTGRRGMLIAYATQADAVAKDGDGRNSPFTTALVQEIEKPGVEVTEMFRNVSYRVNQATGGLQSPELSLSPVREFFFSRGESAEQAWARYRSSTDLAKLKEFVDKFPASFQAEDARQRMTLLQQLQQFSLAEKERAAREEAERRREEDERRAVAERLQKEAERKRLAEEQKRSEDERRRVAEEQKLRQEEERRRVAEDQKRLKDEQERQRRDAELKRQDEIRLAREAETKRIESQRREAELKRLADETAARERQEAARRDDAARQEVARREAEHKRIAEEQGAWERREAQRREAEQRVAEQRVAEERRQAEQARLAEQKRLAEEEGDRLRVAALEKVRAEQEREFQERTERRRLEWERQARELEAQNRAQEEKVARERAERERIEIAKIDQARIEQAKIEQARIEQTRVEQARVDLARAETERRRADEERGRREQAAREQFERERVALLAQAEADRRRAELETAAASPRAPEIASTVVAMLPQSDDRRIGPLAAVSPDGAAPPDLPARVPAAPKPVDTPDLVRGAQDALRELGCYKGRSDGRLTPATKAALGLYTRKGGRGEAAEGVTEDLVAAIKAEEADLCVAADPPASVARPSRPAEKPVAKPKPVKPEPRVARIPPEPVRARPEPVRRPPPAQRAAESRPAPVRAAPAPAPVAPAPAAPAVRRPAGIIGPGF